MEPNVTRTLFRVCRSLTPLVGLAALAAGQAPELDLGALDHAYSQPKVLPGLDDTGLDELENAPDHNPVSDEGARLGRVLFYDPRLSRNGRTACASCHLQEHAFADGRATSRGFQGRRTGRNSMSLVNLAYYSSGKFFWDERGGTLEEMVLMPIQDEVEMGMNLTDLVERLEQDGGYRWLFWKAYGDPEVTTDRIAFALAQFLRSMTSFQSRFDQGLAAVVSVEDDFPNFTAAENRGKRIFLGLESGDRETSCASCHLRDPAAERSPAERRRAAFDPPERPRPVLFQGLEATNNGIDSGRAKDDPGLAGVSLDEKDRGRFKAPSLRNVDLTGPYMHDGRFETLEAVVEHYSTGIARHPNLDERLRPGGRGWRGGTSTISSREPGVLDLPPGMGPKSLGVLRFTRGNDRRRSSEDDSRFGFEFTRAQEDALVAFLRTLTDETFVRDPRFADPFR